LSVCVFVRRFIQDFRPPGKRPPVSATEKPEFQEILERASRQDGKRTKWEKMER
jgi:hypothetical protein